MDGERAFDGLLTQLDADNSRHSSVLLFEFIPLTRQSPTPSLFTVAIDLGDWVERAWPRLSAPRPRSLITISELDRSRRAWICVQSQLDTTRARSA